MPGFGPGELLDCYRTGVFPMADSADDPRLYLIEPPERANIPLEGFHLPRRLRRTVRQDKFAITINQDFDAVVAACAAPAPDRRQTWINGPIRWLYSELHNMGHAHSVECRINGQLAGGLYGVSLGAAFFGESMFSYATDASKVALVHLVARLKTGGFTLLDAQFMTDHLSQFGTEEVPAEVYRERLAVAVAQEADFFKMPEGASGDYALQSIGQTS
ncbi:leucyl/phenylalanyl-tRNA--protein transferase [Hyphobacterium sp. CCMP332]|uniref:leucyl/phenylalanyl-tRNA--protein transferase n=1 Tax=Hyphobacterium sp. CCMP332 TaxID=2749086 RepID=UPI0016507EAD|nr:leucyl/phenylalanyl-tRNA--protein transferase [Hyphobacterium sp. CCMP332]QNL18577.1 leucyl/phenylalanyl-tRNA--protein transferase [Hyphobacterium sp. CCMP332]